MERLPEHQEKVNELYSEMETLWEMLDHMHETGKDISFTQHNKIKQAEAEFNRYADMTTEEWKTHNA